MGPEIVISLVGIVVNAAVTYGVISTKLEWLRRDVDHMTERLDRLELAHAKQA